MIDFIRIVFAELDAARLLSGSLECGCDSGDGPECVLVDDAFDIVEVLFQIGRRTKMTKNRSEGERLVSRRLLFDGQSDTKRRAAIRILDRGKPFAKTSRAGKEIDDGNRGYLFSYVHNAEAGLMP